MPSRWLVNNFMVSKLPGYEQAQQLTRLYKKAGFSDEEIAEELVIMENLLLDELITETEQQMNEEEKEKFDKFLQRGPKSEEIAAYLKLDSKKIAAKIESRLQETIDQYQQTLTKQSLGQ